MIFSAFFFIKLKKFTLNVTLKSNRSNIITILGESGSGKTTFLNCIAGLIKPQKSFLQIKNNIYQNSKKNLFIQTNKRKIGYITQTPILFPHLSVIENILFGKKNNVNYINTTTLLHVLNLTKLFKRKITDLSGGEKQRILIAQVLLTQPEIIILDEPLSAQDNNIKKNFITYIRNIHEKFNIPIIWVSHNITELTTLSKKIIVINKGKIIYTNI